MFSLRFVLVLALPLSAFVWMARTTNAAANPQDTDRARQLVDAFIKQIRPLDLEANYAWWTANMTGKEEDYKRKEEAQNKIDAFLSDKEGFAQIKAIKEKGRIDDPVTKRAIDVIYLAYLEKQVDPALLKKLTALGNSVEQKFSTYRAKVGGKEMADAELRQILKTSTQSERRKEVWEASKKVGEVVAPELKELVKLRNEAARQLGFANYHAMQLYLNEQNGDDLIKLFDRLDDLTREPFTKAKAEIDAVLARNCNVKVDELMPWHYHDLFFQETPSVFQADLDTAYAKQDIVRLARDFYRGIDLPIDLVIEKTGNDFSPRPGKNPHAFCSDLTRDGSDMSASWPTLSRTTTG